MSRCRRAAQQTGLEVILEDRGVWALAQGMGGSGCGCALSGRVDSSSSRTGHGTGKGTLCPKWPRAELTKVPFIFLASCIPARWYFPVPVTHVIGPPGAIPPVRPRGSVVQISESTLRSKTLAARHACISPLHFFHYPSVDMSGEQAIFALSRGEDVHSPSAHFRGPESRRIEGQLASFLRAWDGQDCITSTPLPLQLRHASVCLSETYLRHALVYLLPACLPESADR